MNDIRGNTPAIINEQSGTLINPCSPPNLAVPLAFLVVALLALMVVLLDLVVPLEVHLVLVLEVHP